MQKRALFVLAALLMVLAISSSIKAGPPQIPPTVAVFGRVYDTKGNPLANVNVTITYYDQNKNFWTARATTGANGRYQPNDTQLLLSSNYVLAIVNCPGAVNPQSASDQPLAPNETSWFPAPDLIVP
jgi:hypothetical protein